MIGICVFSYTSQDLIPPALCLQDYCMDWHLPGETEFFSSHPHALHLALTSLMATAHPLHLKLWCTQRRAKLK